jgi:hypothetical protein
MQRKLLSDNNGNVGTVILAVATAITIAVSILVIYSVMGGLNTTTVDANFNKNVVGWAGTNGSRPAYNASINLIAGLGTFFTIAPIYLVVLIAVAIIGAVMGIMVVRGRQ